MKITSVDIWTVVVPTIPGRVHSPEYEGKAGWDEVPKHIIRVDTDTEYYGLGETGRGLRCERDVKKREGQKRREGSMCEGGRGRSRRARKPDPCYPVTTAQC